MKVLIIEDEEPASRKLLRLLKNIDPEIDIVDALKSVEEAVNWFSANSEPDLILMDIQLEDGICFEIFEKHKITAPVIFTTAYDKYTLQAFKVNSVDYLLKPVVPDELAKAIDKYKDLHLQRSDLIKLEFLLNQVQTKNKERFLIKIGEHYRSVSTSDIHCFYIRERCNFIFINTGKNYPVDHSLDKIEQMIDQHLFFRINRNFIINFSAIIDIIAYSSNRLKIVLADWPGEDEVLVSRERVSEFKKWMDR